MHSNLNAFNTLSGNLLLNILILWNILYLGGQYNKTDLWILHDFLGIFSEWFKIAFPKICTIFGSQASYEKHAKPDTCIPHDFPSVFTLLLLHNIIFHKYEKVLKTNNDTPF